MNIGDPFAVTPRPGNAWRGMSDAERIAAVVSVAAGWNGEATLISVAQSGTLLMQFDTRMTAGDRGEAARSIEAHLQQIDPGLTVSTMPKIDRNRIRQLRGVTIL